MNVQKLRTPDIYYFTISSCRTHIQIWLASIVRGSIEWRNSGTCSNRFGAFWYVGFVAIFRYQCHQLRIVWIIRWTWNNDDGQYEDRKHNSRFHSSIERKSATSGFTGLWCINAYYRRVSIPLKRKDNNMGEINIPYKRIKDKDKNK